MINIISYEQKANYVNVELYDEDVIDFDSPFADVVASDTQGMITYMSIDEYLHFMR